MSAETKLELLGDLAKSIEEFEEWYVANKSHLTPFEESPIPLAKNLAGVIHITAKEAWLACAQHHFNRQLAKQYSWVEFSERQPTLGMSIDVKCGANDIRLDQGRVKRISDLGDGWYGFDTNSSFCVAVRGSYWWKESDPKKPKDV